MKKFLSSTLLLFHLLIFSQENIDAPAIKIVKMSVDKSEFNMMRGILTFNIENKDIGEKALKDYDDSFTAFLQEIEKYYTSEFSFAELTEILQFYNSPVGAKIISDKKRLIENKLPPNNEWGMAIYQIKKKIKKIFGRARKNLM